MSPRTGRARPWPVASSMSTTATVSRRTACPRHVGPGDRADAAAGLHAAVRASLGAVGAELEHGVGGTGQSRARRPGRRAPCRCDRRGVATHTADHRRPDPVPLAPGSVGHRGGRPHAAGNGPTPRRTPASLHNVRSCSEGKRRKSWSLDRRVLTPRSRHTATISASRTRVPVARASCTVSRRSGQKRARGSSSRTVGLSDSRAVPPGRRQPGPTSTAARRVAGV